MTDLQGCKLQTAPTRTFCKYDPIHANKKVEEIVDTETCDAWFTENMATFGCDYTNDTGDLDIEAYKVYLEDYDAASYQAMLENPDWDWDLVFKDTLYPNMDWFSEMTKSILSGEGPIEIVYEEELEHGYTLALSLFALVNILSILV